MRIRSASLYSLFALGLVGLLVGQTCAPPPDVNNSPNADAGNNQNVGFGDAVTLDGSGSSDADGDTLTFSWTQTGGTNAVTLSGADTATATFTAPSEADSLQFELVVSDGTETSDDTVTVNVTDTTPPPVVTPTLFIANFDGDNVTSYADPSTVNGNIVPDTNLQGAQTQIFRPSDIVVNAGGALLVSNFNAANSSITSYDDAPNTNGNLAPDRNVQGAATLLVQPVSLVADTANDLIFVADQNDDNILVFGPASTSAFNGNLAPIRIIATTTTGDLNNPTGINLGADDDLYVANNAGNNVLVFANAANLNGDVTPTRIIESDSFDNTLFDVFIDQDDNLFVVEANGFIYTFNDASSLNGNVDPDFTLEVPPAGNLTAIAVDSNNTGYIVDNVNDAIYSYDNISTQNGTVNPDRTIQGANTQLDGPIRVFLTE
jgi:hypothetical protein